MAESTFVSSTILVLIKLNHLSSFILDEGQRRVERWHHRPCGVESNARQFRCRFPMRIRRNDIAPSATDAYVSLTMQLSLFDRAKQIELTRTQHGGDVRRGQRKLERPVSTQRPMHLVLTSRRA
jgi:hypothetical protein